ncbi:hypothetical protein [Acinetobacter sp. YH12027]|uniref:hypothetical protein n=1 Tax=Acinetobacter sp. YH12027 TaxID=2601043 RepID=UPI0015D23970|nr:hypothetical protein [Acinetobacter sp. YH12027]
MNTLNSKVRKDLKDTLFKNKTYIKTKWCFPEGSIILWSTFYRVYLLIITLLFLTLTLYLKLCFNFKYENNYSDLFRSWSNLLEWQGTILSGQLTIIAIVYPLVVGFISIFFNSKHSNSVIFPIYKKYSGFMFAGLSGIGLSLFILFGFLLEPILSTIDYLAYCLASITWFAFNILLTAWFFTKTFKILNDSTREIIIKRFSIQVACYNDIKHRLKNNFIKNSISLGFIKNKNEDLLKISQFSWNDKNNTYTVNKKLDEGYEISNINFSLINFCINFQTYLIKRNKLKDCELILEYGYNNTGYFTLAKCKNFKFNKILQYIFKLSFSFKKTTYRDNDEDLLKNFDTFIEPAYLALKDNDFRSFSKSINSIANYHTDIAETLSFKNDNNEPDNWLLLSSGELFGRTYFNNLMKEYHHLAQQSVEKISINTEFYKEILYLYKRLYGYRSSLTQLETTTFLKESYNMWVLLLKWRSFEIKSNTKSINNYEDILYTFVSSWESWIQHYIEYKSKRSYGDNQKLLAFTTHLQLTASTVISALSFGNTQAIQWGVDMLNNWLEGFSSREYLNDEYNWNMNLINFFLLNQEKDNKFWLPILNGSIFSINSAYELAFQNLQIDLRILTACFILRYKNKLKKNDAKKYITALLKGDRFHLTSTVLKETKTISNAGEVLGIFIRQRDYPFYGHSSYGDWLNTTVETLNDIFKERIISGRVYMGEVASIYNLKIYFVELALSLSISKWDLPRKWYSSIFSSFYRHQDIDSIIADLNSWKQIINAHFNESHNFTLIENADYNLLKDNFMHSIDLVISQLQYQNDQRIIDAEIDRERLIEMEILSSHIFTAENNQFFPLSLFKDIQQVSSIPDQQASGSLSINNYQKQYIAKGIEVSHVSNEEEWIKDAVQNNVKNTILAKVMNLSETFDRSFNSIDDLLNVVLSVSQSMPSPIFFVGDPELKKYLRKLQWENKDHLANFITFKNNQASEYICNIGSCETFSTPFTDMSYCILTSKDIFDKLIAYKNENGNVVQTIFELIEPDQLEGKLIFKYWLDLCFKQDVQIFKLILNLTTDS